MRDLKTYELAQNYQKATLRFADNYRLSQSINEANKHKHNWRSMFNPINRRRK